MVALRLVSDTTDRPRHVTRRECVSTYRMKSLKAHEGHSNSEWQHIVALHKNCEGAERAFSSLKHLIAKGEEKQEQLLSVTEALNSRCDALRDEYRYLLGARLSPSREFISFTDANKGEVAQIAELKEVLINARARKALIDYCGKELTTAAERIAAGADLAWAEREFDYTSQGWVAFKKKLTEQLNKVI